jgi:hypothetical protein
MHVDFLFTLIGAFPVIAIWMVGVAVIASAVKQFVWPTRTAQKSRRLFHFSIRNAALGLALLPFAILYQPSLAEVAKAELRQQEETDEDDNGEPESPVKNLLRQLRRIRRGERVETLSVRTRSRHRPDSGPDLRLRHTPVCGRIDR